MHFESTTNMEILILVWAQKPLLMLKIKLLGSPGHFPGEGCGPLGPFSGSDIKKQNHSWGHLSLK